MSFTKLIYKSGFYTEGTDTDSANRIVDGNHTRFYKGFPMKVGGSVKTSVSSFLGYCRGLDAWTSLTGKKYIALGTHLKLYIDEGGTFYDITPISASGTYANNPLTTTISTTSVNVLHVAHGQVVGNYLTTTGATAVGGLTITGEYTVTTVVDADNFTITAASAASSSANGGGASVTYAYQIEIGSASTVEQNGWGGDTWGTTPGWGVPRTAAGFIDYARTWVVSNYGEDLVASPRDGGIYMWDSSTGTSTRAVIVSNAPTTNKFVLVSPENRYIIAMGAHDGSSSDPMLIRWSSQDDSTDWTPTTINTAGDNRLSEGNMVMTAVSSRGQIIISTDTTIYAMFPDSELVFGFKTLGVGGCISPNGMVEYNGIVYWIGSNNFYMYDGTIRIMPCDVRQYIFDRLDSLQSYKVYAWVNSTWNEIWYWFQSNDGSECNEYVAHSLDGTIWHFGTWARTAGFDKGVVTDNPIATGANGIVYAQESGLDDDGSPLSATYTTGSPQDHNRFTYIRKMLPNFKTIVGNITAVFTTKNYMQSSASVTSPEYNITSDTSYICPRIKGDEFYITFTSNVLGGDFLAGTMQVQVIGTGGR